MGLTALRMEDLPHYNYDDYVQWDGRWEIINGIPPVLVFEVLSPSTSRKDRILKYHLYQAAGVKYYCIVDPETKCAEVFMLKYSEYEKFIRTRDAVKQFPGKKQI